MPSTIKLAEEHGDSVGIILVESQGATFDAMERFAWDQGWMGTSAMWTSEAPVDSKSNYLPSYVFLDAHGKVLSRGNPIEDHGKIEDLIAEQQKLATRAPEDAPKALEKPWKEFLAGKPNKALELAQKLVEKGGPDAAAATTFISDVNTRLERRLNFIERQLDTGYGLLAKANFESFARGVNGVESMADRVKTFGEKLASPDVVKELAAEESLEGLLGKAYEDGLDEKLVKRLTKFAEANAGTRAADRATRLARL